MKPFPHFVWPTRSLGPPMCKRCHCFSLPDVVFSISKTSTSSCTTPFSLNLVCVLSWPQSREELLKNPQHPPDKPRCRLSQVRKWGNISKLLLGFKLSWGSWGVPLLIAFGKKLKPFSFNPKESALRMNQFSPVKENSSRHFTHPYNQRCCIIVDFTCQNVCRLTFGFANQQSRAHLSHLHTVWL